MKIDVSKIRSIKNASLDIDITDKIKGLANGMNDYKFVENVNFKGSMENSDGVLRLKGHLKAAYSTKCFRCLKEIRNCVELNISEIFSTAKNNGYEDAYLYEGEYVEIDDAIRDNIFLNMPMKKVCSIDCKGLCPSCGKDMNTEKCNCKIDVSDPRLEGLKNYFK